MRKKTPQEKKRLSLERDRRNIYHEAPHAARKSIPLRKKLRNRANRHQQEAQLPSGPLEIGSDAADLIEQAMRSKAPKVWKKTPDAPLSQVIDEKQWKRATPKSARSTIVLHRKPAT